MNFEIYRNDSYKKQGLIIGEYYPCVKRGNNDNVFLDSDNEPHSITDISMHHFTRVDFEIKEDVRCDGEPEYLDTTTDAGFRAVVTALTEYHMHAVSLHMEEYWADGFRDGYRVVDCDKLPVIELVEYIDGTGAIYRIKNPNYKEPEPEPEIGQVWLDNHHKRCLVLAVGDESAELLYDGGRIYHRGLSKLIKFTGETINLDALKGSDDES